jgi:hypothetical protein
MLDVKTMFDDGEVVDVHEAIQMIGASARTVRRLASDSVAFRGGNYNRNQPTLYWRHEIEKIAENRRSHRCRVCDSPTRSPSFATCGMILTEWRRATQTNDIERYVFVAKRCRTNVATVYSVVKRMQA